MSGQSFVLIPVAANGTQKSGQNTANSKLMGACHEISVFDCLHRISFVDSHFGKPTFVTRRDADWDAAGPKSQWSPEADTRYEYQWTVDGTTC